MSQTKFEKFRSEGPMTSGQAAAMLAALERIAAALEVANAREFAKSQPVAPPVSPFYPPSPSIAPFDPYRYPNTCQSPCG